MKDTVTIGYTSKGARVWLQSLESKGFLSAQRYDVHMDNNTILIKFCKDGKRKLCPAKGGIVDIVGKKVSLWAGGQTEAEVTYCPSYGIITVDI